MQELELSIGIMSGDEDNNESEEVLLLFRSGMSDTQQRLTEVMFIYAANSQTCHRKDFTTALR